MKKKNVNICIISCLGNFVSHPSLGEKGYLRNSWASRGTWGELYDFALSCASTFVTNAHENLPKNTAMEEAAIFSVFLVVFLVILVRFKSSIDFDTRF